MRREEKGKKEGWNQEREEKDRRRKEDGRRKKDRMMTGIYKVPLKFYH